MRLLHFDELDTVGEILAAITEDSSLDDFLQGLGICPACMRRMTDVLAEVTGKVAEAGDAHRIMFGVMYGLALGRANIIDISRN